jgi:ribonucleoside-diphosphate reductase alpha chain
MSFETAIGRHIWDTKYRLIQGDTPVDRTIEDTWRRVAAALAAAEADPARWEPRFYQALEDFRFLPGGRILAGAGTDRDVTLFNCFVMGTIDDSMDGIFAGLREGAITMQAGGGVGYDFSTLRPAGTRARRTGNVASGPVSFMRIWDATCATLLSTGARRGAMMGTLRCDHPDIEEFVEAKRDDRELRNFNLSVLVSDDFMAAVEGDLEWPLVFPDADIHAEGELVQRQWPGYGQPVSCRVLRTIAARDLWRRIMLANYGYAEPGVLFSDRINATNNLSYCEHISATNPCGEIPLPSYGACDLGAINLTRFVIDPFSERARLDIEGIAETAAVATRMLDNVIDVSRFPLPAQAEGARASRRLGLGFTGLANALAMLGQRYASDAGRETAARAMEAIRNAAYRASAEAAGEKGPFPLYNKDLFRASARLESLPGDIQEQIEASGLRNSHLTTIAPCGTTSLLADNISSGVEPVFSFSSRRRVRRADGGWEEFELSDWAYRLWFTRHGDKPLPDFFESVEDLEPSDHLAMQAILQPFVDNAISKTINVSENTPFDSFESIYRDAHRLGLKGCTTYRPNPVTGAVLSSGEADPSRHCCTPEREAD